MNEPAHGYVAQKAAQHISESLVLRLLWGNYHGPELVGEAGAFLQAEEIANREFEGREAVDSPGRNRHRDAEADLPAWRQPGGKGNLCFPAADLPSRDIRVVDGESLVQTLLQLGEENIMPPHILQRHI